jgi:putative oxidoreductase
LAYIAVPAEFFGGIALILGIATRYVVLVMIVFMLVATFSSHRYWEFTDVAVRRAQDSSFYKNIAMLGGFLFLFVVGPGRFSLDAWLRRQR